MKAFLVVACAVALNPPSNAAAAPNDADLKAAAEKVGEYLKGINGQDRARVTSIKDDLVPNLFPKHVFIAVLYPQFPVGRPAPEPLKVANIVAVPTGDGKVLPISDIKELEKFFKEAAPRKAKGETDILKAWLRLSSELAQDGFYRFKEPQGLGGSGKASSDGSSEAQVDGAIAVEPVGGNKGEITASIHFKNGVIEKIDHKVNLSPGPRPRCQATKLLDPDPIVRQMAEDSIRVMGSAAKYYLDEQRAKATPELEKAIDRIWQRILEEGR
jgi:hypothetical protein